MTSTELTSTEPTTTEPTTTEPAPAQPTTTEPDEPELPLASPRLRRAWLLVDVALVALVLAALAVVGVTARGVLEHRADDRARSEALDAARRLALSFTSLDYRTFDQDAQRVADEAGGQLRQQFTDERSVLKKAMTTNRSVTRGRVLDAAVVDADRDSARVLLVVDADVTNTSTSEPVARHYRMQLDLSHVGGRWLGTDLTFVG